jgi:hypothetical protein
VTIDNGNRWVHNWRAGQKTDHLSTKAKHQMSFTTEKHAALDSIASLLHQIYWDMTPQHIARIRQRVSRQTIHEIRERQQKLTHIMRATENLII